MTTAADQQRRVVVILTALFVTLIVGVSFCSPRPETGLIVSPSQQVFVAEDGPSKGLAICVNALSIEIECFDNHPLLGLTFNDQNGPFGVDTNNDSEQEYECQIVGKLVTRIETDEDANYRKYSCVNNTGPSSQSFMTADGKVVEIIDANGDRYADIYLVGDELLTAEGGRTGSGSWWLTPATAIAVAVISAGGTYIASRKSTDS